MSETPRFKRKALNLANADGSFLARSASCLIAFSQVRLTVETWIRFLPRAPLKRQICLGGRLDLRRRRRAEYVDALRLRRTSTALPARATSARRWTRRNTTPKTAFAFGPSDAPLQYLAQSHSYPGRTADANSGHKQSPRPYRKHQNPRRRQTRAALHGSFLTRSGPPLTVREHQHQPDQHTTPAGLRTARAAPPGAISQFFLPRAPSACPVKWVRTWLDSVIAGHVRCKQRVEEALEQCSIPNSLAA